MASKPSSLPAILNPPLSGREAVQDALYRCLTSFDTNDYALFDSSYLADGSMDLNGRVTTGLKDIHEVLLARLFTIETTHIATNVRVDFMSDREAKLNTTVLAQHFAGGKGMDITPDEIGEVKNHNKHLMSGAIYYGDLALDQSDGLWKFKDLIIKPIWVEGDFSVVGGNFSEEG